MKNVDFSNPGISFVTGSPISHDIGLLILSIDALFHEDEAHSLLVVKGYDAASGILVPSNCCDILLTQHSGSIEGYFLGEDGAIWHYNGKTIEAISSIASNKNIEAFRSYSYSRKFGYLAVGGGNTVFLNEGESGWSELEISMDSEIDQYKYVGFEKALSSSEGIFYLFGWHGIGYMLSGDKTIRLDLPTNVDIYDAALTDDGFIYACGDQGTVFYGVGKDNWKIVDNELTDDKLWGVCSFKEKIFVCSMTSLYEIVDNELRLVDYSELSVVPNFTYRLKSSSDCIWSIGSKQLVQYDGVDWRQLLMLE